MHIHIRQAGEFRVPRVHAPDMAAEGYLQPTAVVGVIEIVVPLRIRTESGVVGVGRQRQRSAAAPTADQLCCQQFPFLIRASIRAKESIEGTDARLIFAEPDEGAIATENVRLRHREWNAGFARIAENELARLDRPSPARWRLDAAALDRRLIDAVLVTERIEIVWLR